jgi:hypothetical protein
VNTGGAAVVSGQTGRSELVDVAVDAAGAAYAFNTFPKGKEVGNIGFLTIGQLNMPLAG